MRAYIRESPIISRLEARSSQATMMQTNSLSEQ